MRFYGKLMVALVLVHGATTTSKADLITFDVTDTGAIVNTNGIVGLGELGSVVWTGDGDEPLAAMTSETATFSVSGDPKSSGTGEADSTVTLFGGGHLKIEGNVSVELEQLDSEGFGSGDSLSEGFVAFDLHVPHEITAVDAADGVVQLVIGEMFFPIVTGTPGPGEIGVGYELAVGSYALEGLAETTALMIPGAGGVTETDGFLLDITFSVIPEPSTIALMTLVCCVVACSAGWQNRKSLLQLTGHIP